MPILEIVKFMWRFFGGQFEPGFSKFSFDFDLLDINFLPSHLSHFLSIIVT